MLSKRGRAAGATAGVVFAGVAVTACAVVAVVALREHDRDGSVTTRIECLDAVVWRGVTYVAYEQLQVARAAPLGTAQIPCRGGDPERNGDGRRSVRVHGLGRVPAAVAIAVDGKAYLAEGSLVPLRSHPLHRRVYGRDDRPRAPGRACRDPYEWDAAVISVIVPLGEGIVVRRQGEGEEYLKVHAATRLVGLSRGGEPYLRRGDRVRVRGVRCRNSDLVVNEVRRRA